MKPITFTSDGYKLAGNLVLPKGEPKQLAVLLIQGWAGHQNTRAAQMLADAGYTAMTYDMRGNGDSEGDMSQSSRAEFIQDAVVAYDYFKVQLEGDIRIVVVGSSFGGYTGVLLSQEREVAALSLRVPANYPNEGFNQPQLAQKNATSDFSDWRHVKHRYDENRALQVLHNFDGPVQIIRAEADKLVPREVPESYAEAVANPAQLTYQLMAGAPHELSNEALQAEYEKLLKEWVATL